MRRLVAALILLVLFTGEAAADELRPGYIEFVQQDKSNWSLHWKQPMVESFIGSSTVPIIPGNCRLIGKVRREFSRRTTLGFADLNCTGPLNGQQIGMPNLGGNSEVLVRVAALDDPVQFFRLTPSTPRVTIPTQAQSTQTFSTYFKLGVEHILAGWDHLLFVVALVLMIKRLATVVAAATAFTLAHSLTLVGTTLGFVGLPQQPVEALIALSILLLAVEITKPHSEPESLARRFPSIIAFSFGLVHGFGFAGALGEIGLPDNEVPLALLAFNLGVEIGQLLIVAAVLAVRSVIRRMSAVMIEPATRLASYAIGIISSYWLIDRLVS